MSLDSSPYVPGEENGKLFPFVNNASQNVQNKFLEGVPYNGTTIPQFPGPFFGETQQGMNQYETVQRNAVNNYANIATQPLKPFSKTFPANNIQTGQNMSCADSYPQQMRMFPTFDPNPNNINVFQRESPDNSMQPYGMNFENMSQIPNGMGMAINMGANPNPEMVHHMAHNGKRIEESNFVNGVDLMSGESRGVEEFKDDSISDPCNQTGFGKIVPEFVKFEPNETPGWVSPTDQIPTMGKSVAEDIPLLEIEKRPVDQFSHNNMVPYYGAKLTQNMRGTGVPQAGDNNSSSASTDGFADQTPWRGKLAAFTGCDDMWMHKREVGPMFSPAEQQTGWVFGTPAFRPDMDRYKTDVIERRNESPVESINVGPGIALDYTVPAAGGFQQFTRILPNNVNDYKANQLEGRVKTGKWFVNHPTSQYINGVNQNQPKVEWTQARRPTMQTKFSTNAPEGGSARLTNWSLATERGKLARTDTEISAGYGQLDYDKIEQFQDGKNNGPKMPCVSFSEAPVGKVMGSHVPAQSMELGSYNTIRETFKRGAAGWKNGKYWECPEESQGANEWGLIMGPGQGVVPNNEQREGWYVNLTDRGDVNPFVINVTGTEANPGGVWSPNSFQDEQRVTTRQTTLFSHVGGPTGEKATEMFWTDDPKVTVRETTMYAHQGGPTGAKASENFWSDLPRTTTKETVSYAHQGGTAGSVPALGDRFAYTGADYFNPMLNSGNHTMNSEDSNRGKGGEVYSLQDRTQGRPVEPSDTTFVPGREDFKTLPAQFGIKDFFHSVKLLAEEAFGEVETFIWGPENSRVEHYGDRDASGNQYFDPKLFESGQGLAASLRRSDEVTRPSWQTVNIADNEMSEGQRRLVKAESQWRKGGMTSNGLRSAAEVWNRFPTPGRSNIVPDPNQPLDVSTDNPAFIYGNNGMKHETPVSSIGTYQTRGTKQIASGTYGPGSLLSANVQLGAGHQAIKNDMTQGYVRQNPLRSQFVDYRSTAPFLVDNLRKNPLSIYATRDNIDKPIPEFFNMVKPDNFATYISEPEVPIMPIEKQLYVDGSPQSTILGLAEQNPLLGITTGIPNANPKFSGKAYSGKKADLSIYNMAWTDDFGNSAASQWGTHKTEPIEGFGNSTHCQNKALDFAAQGYNISKQINDGQFIEWGSRTNLPWGPISVTGNPLTQLGGIWPGNVGKGTYNVVNRRDYPLHMTDAAEGTFKLDQRIPNDYKNGLPGSLVV